MTYLIVKALLSGIIIAAVSEIARRAPGLGALIVSLPLVSLLTMIWLWRDTGEPERVAALAESSFWFFLPSLPFFLVLPLMLRGGVPFWAAMALGCALTVALYLGTVWIGARFGLRL
jgi:ABC-type uncharacterized transport system YnjBCD permease subunit